LGKYCTHCGKETIEGAVVCLSCGHLIDNKTNTLMHEPIRREGKTVATLSVVFGILGLYPFVFIGSIVGFILALTGLSDKNSEYRGRCKIGLIISIITFLFWVFMILFYFLFFLYYFDGFILDPDLWGQFEPLNINLGIICLQ
jgi:hypothetical protein